MEKLNITTTKDNEKVYKILGDLMNANKEFQIMITVPSTKNAKDSIVKATEKKEQTQKVQAQVEEVVSQSVAAVEEANEPEKKSKKKNSEQPTARAEVKEQRTIARKRDKALLAALFVFTIVVAGIAALGMLLIQPPKDITQGQADCEQVRVSGKLPGRVVRFYVKEGDYVHVGDTLAILDAPEVEAKKTQAESAEDAAAAMKAMADNGARRQQIQGAFEVWQQAKAGLEISKKTYDRVQRLFNEGVMSAQKRDEAFAAYKAYEAQERAAKSQYDMAREGARKEERAAAAAQVNRARGAVQEVSSYINETVQIAQVEGEVSDIYPKVGELVGTGSPIMSISIMSDVWGTFNVREDQLNGLKTGSEFTAYSPAFKKDIKMKVYYIKDQGSYAVWKATKSNGQYDLKTFEVKARPVGKLDGLRPGMTLVMK